MFKWRNPTLKEYLLTAVAAVFFTGMLIPTCLSSNSAKLNERTALSNVHNFFSNQLARFRQTGKYYSNEEAQTSQNFSEWSKAGYDAVYDSDGKTFKLWLIPKNYGKEARRSFYTDSLTGVVHGADRQGEKAGAGDPFIEAVSAEVKKELIKNNEQK